MMPGLQRRGWLGWGRQTRSLHRSRQAGGSRLQAGKGGWEDVAGPQWVGVSDVDAAATKGISDGGFAICGFRFLGEATRSLEPLVSTAVRCGLWASRRPAHEPLAVGPSGAKLEWDLTRPTHIALLLLT